jgi:hypothetical protein
VVHELEGNALVTVPKSERSWAHIARQGKALSYVPAGKLQKVELGFTRSYVGCTQHWIEGRLRERYRVNRDERQPLLAAPSGHEQLVMMLVRAGGRS